MVTSEPAVVDEFVTTAPHRHRPIHYSEPYTECGVRWVIGVCECGEQLAPRRAASVREASA